MCICDFEVFWQSASSMHEVSSCRPLCVADVPCVQELFSVAFYTTTCMRLPWQHNEYLFRLHATEYIRICCLNPNQSLCRACHPRIRHVFKPWQFNALLEKHTQSQFIVLHRTAGVLSSQCPAFPWTSIPTAMNRKPSTAKNPTTGTIFVCMHLFVVGVLSLCTSA